jgi:hypothetical protein
MKREFFMQREPACGKTKSTAQSKPGAAKGGDFSAAGSARLKSCPPPKAGWRWNCFAGWKALLRSGPHHFSEACCARKKGAHESAPAR